MREVKQVGIVGAGVIGSAWAARFLINGIDVSLYDPGDGIESRFEEVLNNALRAYRRMTLAPTEAKGKIRFVDSLEAAVSGADFVQESGPERMEIKQALMKEICRHTDAEVIVASSSSGLLPSEMQAGVRHPQRIIVGHPFNPVYLMPLVEIVGGSRTTEETRQRAAGFYRRIGMHPLVVRKEVEAFLADRMMEALWREALHLLNEGVATADELDQAICYGPGIRWAFMGSFLTFRIAGGEGGMRHFMGQFGPALKWPWTRFDGPDLTDELLDRIATQSDEQAAGRSILELERMRDDCIVSILQGLRAQNTAAGKVLASYEEKLYESSHRSEFSHEDDLSHPLRLHSDIVQPEWVDYNNHMTESRYLQVFGDASDALFRYIGVNEDYHQSGMSYYTVETHMNNLSEVEAHQEIEVTTQVLGSDRKRMRIYHEMFLCEDNRLLACAEQMLLHVNTIQGKACPARKDVAERVERITRAHSRLAQPARAGRAISL